MKKGEEEQHIVTDSVIENVSPKPTTEKVKPGRQRESARIETVQTKQELPSSAPAEEDDEDDNNIDLDDPADSDYDVTCDGGVAEVDDIKIESTEDEPRVTRSRKKKLSVVANKQKKKLVKSKRKGQLSVQVSKLKMKISSEKKKGKEEACIKMMGG